MNILIVQALQLIAKGVDKAIPLQGGRTIAVSVLQIVGSISLYLTGKMEADVAALAISSAIGLIFASLHKSEKSNP